MGKTSQVYQLRKEKISHSRYGVLAVHKHDYLLECAAGTLHLLWLAFSNV